jgi:hypothetical protein
LENLEKQQGPRSGRLLESGNHWEQQLQSRKRPPFLKAINNNNYGREATAFLKARQNNGILLDFWEQQLRQQLGTTTTTTTGAKRPPF